MASHRYSIGPVYGEGRTKTQARAAAEARASQELTEYERGVVVIPAPPSMPGATCQPGPLLVSYLFGRWQYEDLGSCPGRGHRSPVTVEGTREDAVYRAVQHYGGMGFDPDAPCLAVERWLEDVRAWLVSVLRDEGEAITLCAGYRDAVVSARRYRAWLECGASPVEAHRAMCERRDPPSE